MRELKGHLAHYGIPPVLVSDNAPQISSQEFKTFVTEWDVEHQTSSPGHQQANGKAEAAVKTAKHILGRAIKSTQDPYLAIFEYHNIPSQDTVSPAQQMFGRMTRTMLPVHTNLLNPKDSALIKQNQKLRDSRKVWYYNQNACDLEHLAEGQTVRMRPLINKKGHWERGTIPKQLDKWSYEIESGSNVFCRNRVDIRPTNDNSVSDTRENTEVKLPDIVQVPNENEAQEPSNVHEPKEPPQVHKPKTTLRRSTREHTVPKYLKDI